MRRKSAREGAAGSHGVRGITRQRAAVAVAAFAVFLVAVVYGVIAAITPPSAPSGVVPGPPLGRRLSERVLLVIVDGLRYDVATDPAIMPRFAASMKRHTSAEMWAGRVSMTTSAVLGLGTGQRGRLEQIVRNIGAEPPAYNSWLANARARGLRLASVGDPAWVELYSNELWKYRRDPEGVAIDVDFNPKTFADTREILALAPDFLVAHFVTPDHQGHAYGIKSERYRAHMRDFDQQLGALLQELDSHFTVIVTSDHGAADSGTHGTDVAIQRRCPIYAYGPGIREGVQLGKPLDQLDLSATLATLLGVPPAAHGTGHLLVEWLQVSEAERTQIACSIARQVLGYTKSIGLSLSRAEQELAACGTSTISRPALELAEHTVRAADTVVSQATGLTSNASLGSMVLIALFGLLLLAVLVPGLEGRAVISGALLVCVTVWLVLIVERLPGVLPNAVRISLFVIGNAALLWLVVRPAQVTDWLERKLPFSLVVAPGALAVSYPADARPQAFVVIVLLGVLCLRKLFESPQGPAAEGPPRVELAVEPPLSAKQAIVLGIAFVMLSPVVLRENAIYSGLFGEEHVRRGVVSMFCAVIILAFGKGIRLENLSILVLIVLGLLPIWFRSELGPWFGRGVWLLSASLFLSQLLAGHRNRALIFGVLSVLWLSRDFEAAPLLATLAAARIVGPRLFGMTPTISPGARILGTLYAFGLLFCLRMGIQDGLEFAGMDWGAGAFKDQNVSPFLVGAALIYKYAVSAILLGIALGSGTLHSTQVQVFQGLTLCLVTRIVCLSGMFFVAGGSFWTALRVIGDLPTALATGLGCLLGLAVSVWFAPGRVSTTS